MSCQCPDCGETYGGGQGTGGHCRSRYGGCCRTFRSQSAYDAHLINFRCGIDVRNAPKWRETDRGWTNSTQMPREAMTWIPNSAERRRSGTSGPPDPERASTVPSGGQETA